MSKHQIELCIEEQYVVKHFINRISYEKEKEMLTLLGPYYIAPRIIKIEDSSITTEYIPSITLYDLLEQYVHNRCSKDVITQAFYKLFVLIEKFNQISVDYFNREVTLCDTNFKNFLLTETGEVRLIDLEEWSFEPRRNTFYSILAWLKCYDFSTQTKIMDLQKELIQWYQKEWNIDSRVIEEEIEIKLKKILQKRKLKKYRNQTTAVIIAGGKSSRMNYHSKSNLLLGRYDFMEHILYELRAFDKIRISSKKENQYQQHNLVNWCDKYQEIGPIAGIYTGLINADTEYIFVTSCDIPNINTELIEYLFCQIEQKYDALVPICKDRIHPLCAIYRTSASSVFLNQIQSENYKLLRALNKLSVKYIRLPEEFQEYLININTPEEYEQAVQKFNGNDLFAHNLYLQEYKKMSLNEV